MEDIKYVNLDDLSNEDMTFIKLAYQIDFNIYYNKNNSNIDYNVNEDLKKRKEECLRKISELSKKDKVNSDKFVILCANNKLKGFIKYHDTIESIYVDSIYGENEEAISILLRRLSNSTRLNLKNTICNLNIDTILKDIAKGIKLEDFERYPNLLNDLTKEQLIEVLNSIKSEQKNVDNTTDTISPEEENVIDGGTVIAVQKKITNGHSILGDDKETKKQGFVDALVLSLLAGFFGGIITTLLILFIKIKTGL